MDLFIVPTGKRRSYLQKYNAFAGKRFVLRLCNIPQGSGAHQPETYVVVPVVRVVVVPVVRVVVVPIGRTDVLRRIVPTPAAFHTVIARDRSPFSHIIFLKRFVLARLMAVKTLRTRSAAFSSVMPP
jgi:hypothetical protein